jgi:tryptophan synthase alpha subunit
VGSALVQTISENGRDLEALERIVKEMAAKLGSGLDS